MVTLFKNGKIFLGKNKFTDEFATDDISGKIIYVKGENPKPDFDNEIDLKKKLVIPAFFDAHCHLFKASQINSELNLRYAKTKSEFELEIKKYIKKNNLNSSVILPDPSVSEANTVILPTPTGNEENTVILSEAKNPVPKDKNTKENVILNEPATSLSRPVGKESLTPPVILKEPETEESLLKDFKIQNPKSQPLWISGGYFSDSNITDNFSPDINFLDSVCPDIPIIISRFDFHSAFINTKAFELSGLINCTEKFEKEEIIFDNNGKFTGELKERAREFVLAAIPVKSNDQLAEDLKTEIKKLHYLGITSVSDITLPFDLDIFEILLSKNELDLFIDSRLPFTSFYKISEYKNRFEKFNSKIRFNGFKAFYDGSLSSESALMHNNYINSNTNGLRTEFVNSGDFKKIGNEIHDAGYQISVHAIGDLAVTELLDFFESLPSSQINFNTRHRIEHAQHIIDKDLDRFKQLGVIASVQPTHLFSDAKTVSLKYKEIQTTHRYKQLIDKGAMVCFGTDFPIVEENPFETLYYAITRKAIGYENGFLPEYNIPLDDCITCYTQNSAYASFTENQRGKISTGQTADFLILEDLFQLTPEDLRTQTPLSTYISAKKGY